MSAEKRAALREKMKSFISWLQKREDHFHKIGDSLFQLESSDVVISFIAALVK